MLRDNWGEEETGDKLMLTLMDAPLREQRGEGIREVYAQCIGYGMVWYGMCESCF